MNPQSKLPGVPLSQPSMEQAVPMPGQGGYGPEMTPSAPESSFQPSAPAYAIPMPQPAGSMPLPPPAQQSHMIDPQQVIPAISAAPQADSAEKLDQEWVNRAKTIVERTKSDPFVESNELSHAKAEFLRLRYNKQIKVADQSK